MTVVSAIRYLLISCAFDGLAFQTLRVYAISGRTWQIALVVGILNIFPDVFDIVSVSYIANFHGVDT